MKFQRFFFQNFRGIRHLLNFNFETGCLLPYCVLGDNESGKTTLLKGIETLGRLLRGIEFKTAEIHTFSPKNIYFSDTVKLGADIVCKKQNFSTNPKIKRYFASMLEEQICLKIEFDFLFEKKAFIKKTIQIFVNGEALKPTKTFSLDNMKEEILDTVKLHIPEIIYYEDFQFVVPKSVRFLPSNTSCSDRTKLDNDINQNWQKVFNDILNGTSEKAGTFQNDVVDWNSKNENEEDFEFGTVQDRLLGMGKYLNCIMQDWIKNNNGRIQRFEVLEVPYNLSSGEGFKDFQLRVVSNETKFELSERSKGMQWAFCFHILTKIRKNRHKNGVIFLLDEPANNLHLHQQEQMLIHLENLCGINSSVIYSTHSPGLISKKKNVFDYILVAKNKSSEFEETNIQCFKFSDTDNLCEQDLEPVFMANVFDDFRTLVNMEDSQSCLHIGLKLFLAKIKSFWKRLFKMENMKKIESTLKISVLLKTLFGD